MSEAIFATREEWLAHVGAQMVAHIALVAPHTNGAAEWRASCGFPSIPGA